MNARNATALGVVALVAVVGAAVGVQAQQPAAITGVTAGTDHGFVADESADEIARLGDFRFERDVAPARPLEDALLLARINRRV